MRFSYLVFFFFSNSEVKQPGNIYLRMFMLCADK
jgi:hypothetical protein